MKKIFLFLALIIFLFSSCGVDEKLFKESKFDWPVWRGPNADGIFANETINPEAVPTVLKEEWNTYVGVGFSSMVTRGEVLYTMGNFELKDTVYCLNHRTGKILWSYSYDCELGSYPGPNSTPALHGDKLITLSKFGDLFCFNARTGWVIWKKQLVEDYGVKEQEYGFAGSPLVYENTIILNAMTHGLALDLENGDIIWKSGDDVGGYATPVLFDYGGSTNVMIFGQKALYAVNPQNGKLLWSFSWETEYDANVADPIIVGSRVFINSGYNKGSACIDFTDNKPVLVWKNRTIKSHFGNCIYTDGFIYGVDGQVTYRNASYKCVEFDTGKEIWSQVLPFGSLISTKEYLVCVSEKGHITIADLSSKHFTQRYSTKISGTQFRSMPILNDQRLFLKDSAKGILYCLSLK
ncbi:MAG: PQQ-like beta-propeller repeat protein [Spirochaetales bacterium]|nr:PQQ-like beta-propeller repeat protein [Spirochaetales bacterium]